MLESEELKGAQSKVQERPAQAFIWSPLMELCGQCLFPSLLLSDNICDHWFVKQESPPEHDVQFLLWAWSSHLLTLVTQNSAYPETHWDNSVKPMAFAINHLLTMRLPPTNWPRGSLVFAMCRVWISPATEPTIHGTWPTFDMPKSPAFEKQIILCLLLDSSWTSPLHHLA